MDKVGDIAKRGRKLAESAPLGHWTNDGDAELLFEMVEAIEHRDARIAALEAQNAGLLDQILELENLRDALEAQLAEAKVTEPVAWQRRIKYPTEPGAVSPWVTCSADEATGHFERSTLHEYRCLYTSPPTSELEALRKRVAEIDVHRRNVLAENERLLNALIERVRRVAELEKALEPFAATADETDEHDADSNHIWEHHTAMNISIGDLRTARRVREGGKVE